MTNNNNSKYLGVAMAVMLAFGIIGAFSASPKTANACGYEGSCYSYNYTNPFGTDIGHRFGYYAQAPVYRAPVVTQPVYIQQPVYVQQPIVTQPIYVQQPVVVQTPVYTQPAYPTTYSPLAVSCSANAISSNTGLVTWTAVATGGNFNNNYTNTNNYYNSYNGNYNYSNVNTYVFAWSGSDNLSGSGQSVTANYNYPGVKTASVTVYLNGQTITQPCSNSVSITNSYYTTSYNNYPTYQTQYQPTYQVSNGNSLDIGCYVDPTNSKVGQPVTWTAEVTGGVAPYTYSWTGSDGLTGTGSSIIKYYDNAGTKSAVVTVTSADGISASHACSATLTVAKKSSGSTVATVSNSYNNNSNNTNPSSQVQPQAQANTNLSAASALSLGNVPWSWVAILIILVLFFTVLYLLFNKQKI